MTILTQRFKYRNNNSIKTLSRNAFMSTSTVKGVVLPSDLDFLLHMNNSKYLREMDFGRFAHFFHNNFKGPLETMGASMVVAAITVRFRRSLQLWQAFQLKTRILGWDDSSFYCEQRFVNKEGFVCAIAMLKLFIQRRTPKEVLEAVLLEPYCPSPPFPPELKAWTQTNSESSQSLKNEQIHHNTHT